MGKITKFGLAASAIVIIGLTVTACQSANQKEDKATFRTTIQTPAEKEDKATIQTTFQTPTEEEFTNSSTTSTQKAVVTELWSEADVDAMALTLAGECYDDEEYDKRLVCEVILNRVCSENFGDTVIEVVTAPNQFAGYWNQSREVSENDIMIVKNTLADWYANDCKPLSGYLYFSTGDNHQNVFRCDYE